MTNKRPRWLKPVLALIMGTVLGSICGRLPEDYRVACKTVSRAVPGCALPHH